MVIFHSNSNKKKNGIQEQNNNIKGKQNKNNYMKKIKENKTQINKNKSDKNSKATQAVFICLFIVKG